MKPENTVARIELRLRELSQLFNSLDPSPFIDRDLDTDAEEFILSWAREHAKERELELVLHLATPPTSERAAGTEAGLGVLAGSYGTLGAHAYASSGDAQRALMLGVRLEGADNDYPFADDCDRIENGRHTTNAPTPAGETRPDPKTASNYSGQWSRMEQFRSGLLHFVDRIRDRRFVAVDPERGTVASFVFFDHALGEARAFQTPDGRAVTAGPTQPWTWEIYEVFKIEKGLIRRIQAITTGRLTTLSRTAAAKSP